MKEFEIKEIKERNINYLASFQDWRVTCPDGSRKYFSSERVAKSYIQIIKGNLR